MPHDALADVVSASEPLEPFLDISVGEHELVAVHAVQRAVVSIVDSLVDGSQPPLDLLNGLARQEPSIYILDRLRDGKLSAAVRPKRASATAALLVAAIEALTELEPARLRRCGRPECKLVFYDITRSATPNAPVDYASGNDATVPSMPHDHPRLRGPPAD
ncbi:MAG: hypothetical protein ACRDNK_17995 [Solirubrobacteraceae bacterium]